MSQVNDGLCVVDSKGHPMYQAVSTCVVIKLSSSVIGTRIYLVFMPEIYISQLGSME